MSTIERDGDRVASVDPDPPVEQEDLDLELALAAGAVALTDEELTAQALAADPDAPLADDAVPFGRDDRAGGLLPSWYMPVPVSGTRKRWHRALVIAAILGFLVINASGFCITYGILEGA